MNSLKTCSGLFVLVLIILIVFSKDKVNFRNKEIAKQKNKVVYSVLNQAGKSEISKQEKSADNAKEEMKTDEDDHQYLVENENQIKDVRNFIDMSEDIHRKARRKRTAEE